MDLGTLVSSTQLRMPKKHTCAEGKATEKLLHRQVYSQVPSQVRNDWKYQFIEVVYINWIVLNKIELKSSFKFTKKLEVPSNSYCSIMLCDFRHDYSEVYCKSIEI